MADAGSAAEDNQPQPVRRTTPPAGIDERHVRSSEGEEPEQLVPADLREAPQTLQLLVREHLSRHPCLQPAPEDPQLRSLLSHIRPKFPGYYGDPVLPDAHCTGQAELEHEILTALAKHVGAHHPRSFGDTAYGIVWVSPAPFELSLRLDDAAAAAFAAAVAPRLTADGLQGVPGLRCKVDARHRVRLTRLGTTTRVTVEKSQSLERALDALAQRPGSTPLWTDPDWNATEQQRVPLSDLSRITLSSRVLRRIHLFATDEVLDFATAMPGNVRLRGPHPELVPGVETLDVADRRGVAIAAMSRRGGTGRTLTLVNVGAALALEGRRVLMIDLDRSGGLGVVYGVRRPPHTLVSMIADGRWEDLDRRVSVVHRDPSGGSVSVLSSSRDLASIFSTTSEWFPQLLTRARQQYDIVLIDGVPVFVSDLAKYIADHIDAVFSCLQLDTALLVETITVYSERYQAYLAQCSAQESTEQDLTRCFDWLDAEFDRHLDIALGWTNERVSLAGLAHTRYERGDETWSEAFAAQCIEMHVAVPMGADHVPHTTAWSRSQLDTFIQAIAPRGSDTHGNMWTEGEQLWLEMWTTELDGESGDRSRDNEGDGGENDLPQWAKDFDDGQGEQILDDEDDDMVTTTRQLSPEEILTNIRQANASEGFPVDAARREHHLGIVLTMVENSLPAAEALRRTRTQLSPTDLLPDVPASPAAARSPRPIVLEDTRAAISLAYIALARELRQRSTLLAKLTARNDERA